MATKDIKKIQEAEAAARGQEPKLERHRDLYAMVGKLEDQIKACKVEMSTIEDNLDFSRCFEEDDTKATGRLRLPDGSYQLTKTVTEKTIVTPDMKLIMKDVPAHDALALYIEMVPVLDVQKAMEDEEARKFLVAPFVAAEKKESTRYTSTLNPRG